MTLTTKQSFYASLSIGSDQVSVPPTTISKLYWAVTVPQMTYGLELLDLDIKTTNSVEQAHLAMAELTQGLPSRVASVCPLAPLGWPSMDAMLMTKSLCLLWQVLLLPMSSVCKRLLVYRLLEHHTKSNINACGPVYSMYKNAQKLEAISTGNYVTIKEWKVIVKRKSRSLDQARWSASCLLYKSLKLYRRVISGVYMWPWWQ